MDTPSKREIEAIFPGLIGSIYDITSPIDPRYNCIAWAAGDSQRWWEPDPMGIAYWPPSAPREYSIEAYQRAFEAAGYLRCSDHAHESECRKVAIFADGSEPKHAARELNSSRWTSKLGRNVDISHDLFALAGKAYGAPMCFLKRSII